ncbi:MAG: thiazole synthase [Proteobacteria bacterium]|jgi:thiazole synthase|nr:thiazole synthase [Pseudomonadota bacterium]MDA0971359.1 thiazole synthase [Pseudomonadota bacterium]MDA0995465.1 thiazole synthase [Pseudomonadota bacterium]
MDVFKIGNKIFKSRLIVGTGKYKDLQETADAVKASGADLVTVAVRRVNIIDTKEPLLMDYIDPAKITYLPNTAGCFTSEDALRTLRLAKESGGWNLVKLEVLGDEKTLYPNMQETIKAAKILVEEGFEVMVYCSDDPIACKILEKIGVVAVMPLGSLIGSGQGIPNKLNIEIIKKQSNIPVIVDAGIGTASDAVIAMELGCDAVLVNSAIAKAKKPLMMAESMKNAVIAGRQSYLSGRMDKINIASASSPINGKINN